MIVEMPTAASVPPAFVDRRAKVWLECNGEPYDRRAVREIGAIESTAGALVVRFVCPRCASVHESLLFR